MNKPLILLAYLGFPNHVLTRANTLISTEIAAMARVASDNGFNVAVAKTEQETPKVLFPSTGAELWDGKTQPESVWFHQAIPSIPGGICPIHEHTLEVLEKVLPKVKSIYRLVVDNTSSMNHKTFMYKLERNGKKCYYVRREKPTGPNKSYQAIYDSVVKHVNSGTFYEVGYESARSNSFNLNFKPCGIFSKQLALTRDLYGPKEKTLDFCYIGSSRGNETKKKKRLESLGEDFLAHQNSFYGGTLFKKRSSIRFPKAWEMMSSSKAHLIVRDSGMYQLPLHRYLQALVHLSIPIVINEPEPVEFIHNAELQSLLRIKSYSEALDLLSNYDSLLPLLIKERDYWIKYDTKKTNLL
jgi:hypothetical protein